MLPHFVYPIWLSRAVVQLFSPLSSELGSSRRALHFTLLWYLFSPVPYFVMLSNKPLIYNFCRHLQSTSSAQYVNIFSSEYLFSSLQIKIHVLQFTIFVIVKRKWTTYICSGFIGPTITKTRDSFIMKWGNDGKRKVDLIAKEYRRLLFEKIRRCTSLRTEKISGDSSLRRINRAEINRRSARHAAFERGPVRAFLDSPISQWLQNLLMYHNYSHKS